MESNDQESVLVTVGNRFATPVALIALVFLVLGVVFAFGRAYRDYSGQDENFNWNARGFSDLHSCYIYAKTFRNGLSPYEIQDDPEFAATRPSAPFSPAIFYLLWPVSCLSMARADVVFSVLNMGMLSLISYWVFRFSNQRFRWHLWIAVLGFIVFSRPGHITLYTGYFTPVLVIGTLMAFHFARPTPWLAAVGVLLASIKPTYFIPLVILLLFRKNFKAALYGTALSIAVAVAGLFWLATDSSVVEVVDSVLVGQAAFDDDPTEFPVNTWTRVDVMGMIAKAVDWIPDKKVYLGCMVLLLLPPGIVIWRVADSERNSGAMGLSALISMLALLVTIYHHSYDCLLIIPATLAMLLFGRTTMMELHTPARRIVVALLLVPSLNYFSTLTFRGRMELDQYGVVWQSITMINGICLTAGLLVLMYYAVRPCRPATGD